MPNSSDKRPVTIRHKQPDSTLHSTARLPDGTWLIHYRMGGSICGIACVRGGEGWGVYGSTHYWGSFSFWQVAVPPGVRLHAVVAGFVAAAQLGVVDLTLLGTLEHGPWL